MTENCYVHLCLKSELDTDILNIFNIVLIISAYYLAKEALMKLSKICSVSQWSGETHKCDLPKDRNKRNRHKFQVGDTSFQCVCSRQSRSLISPWSTFADQACLLCTCPINGSQGNNFLKYSRYLRNNIISMKVDL